MLKHATCITQTARLVVIPIRLIPREANELGVLTQSQQTSAPSQSKKLFAGLGVGAIVIIVLVVAVIGGIGGTVIYQAAQLPNIQATEISVPQATSDPRSSTVVNDGRVVTSDAFDYTTTLPGTYALVFDNGFSVFTSKSVSVTYTVGGTSNTKSFVVNAGNFEKISFTLQTGDRVSGSFSVSGGSNDVDFYITAQTCTQTVNFSFTLVNSGSANGYATVQFQVDGQVYWHNRYFVAQGQHLPESGSLVLSDCAGHAYNVVVAEVQKT